MGTIRVKVEGASHIRFDYCDLCGSIIIPGGFAAHEDYHEAIKRMIIKAATGETE